MPTALEIDLRNACQAHAANRWARTVAGVLECTSDPRTIGSWGRAVGTSPGTIRRWCRAAGVTPKASLDLARLLRALTWSRRTRWDLYNLLDVVDDRTMNRLLRRGGLSDLTSDQYPKVDAFLKGQQLIHNLVALDALTGLMTENGGDAHPVP